MVEAETRPSNLLTSAGGLNEISGSQKKKFKGKAEGAAPVTTIADKRKCGWCNQVGHGGRPSTQVRRGKCKAFHHTCGNCSGIGHHGSVCRSKKEQNLIATGEESQSGEKNFGHLEVSGWGRKRKKTLPYTV